MCKLSSKLIYSSIRSFCKQFLIEYSICPRFVLYIPTSCVKEVYDVMKSEKTNHPVKMVLSKMTKNKL